jgi:hypothetical protein
MRGKGPMSISEATDAIRVHGFMTNPGPILARNKRFVRVSKGVYALAPLNPRPDTHA